MGIREVLEIFNISPYLLSSKKGQFLSETAPFHFVSACGMQEANFSWLLGLHMALGASCWTGRFVGFLRFVVASFAVLVSGIFH
jgi:hypothetical protein